MNDAERNSLNELAEEFVERIRRGERPTVAEYAERAPQYADEICDLFPTLRIMEHAGPGSDTIDMTTFVPGNRAPVVSIYDCHTLRRIHQLDVGESAVVA